MDNTNSTFEVTKPELAQIFNISERTVERLTQSAVLLPVTEPRKGIRQRFDLRENAKRYIAYLNGQAGKRDSECLATEKQRLTAEAKIKMAKSVIADLEAKELQGQMHRSEDVAAMTEDLVYTIRGMMLALPGRLAIDAANLTDPAEVSDLIRREVYQIMEELSRYKYDGKKYDERVRKRRKWEKANREDEADGSGG